MPLLSFLTHLAYNKEIVRLSNCVYQRLDLFESSRVFFYPGIHRAEDPWHFDHPLAFVSEGGNKNSARPYRLCSKRKC